MKARVSLLMGLMAACGLVQADTYYWLGLKTTAQMGSWYSGYAYRCADNWRHQETGKCDGWPVNGDTVVFDTSVTNTASHALGNEFGEYGWGELVYASSHATGDGDIGLLTGGRGVRFTRASVGQILWQSQLKVFGAGEVVLDIPAGSAIDCTGNIKPAPGQEGNRSTLVKRGCGGFVAFTEGGWRTNGRNFTISGVRLEEGIFGVTAARNATDTGTEDGNSIYKDIDFTFAGGSNEVLRIGTAFYSYAHEGDGAMGYSWYLRDSGLYETPNAVNMPHSIESAGGCRLGFFGTPKVNPMRFTGTLELGAGLVWAPGASDYVFELAHGYSSSTGDVVVKNGTLKVVDGARLPNVSSIQVSGSGAVFEVGETGGLFYPKAMLELSDGGRVRVPSGATMYVRQARAGGGDLAAGTVLVGGTSEWVLGTGRVYVMGAADLGAGTTVAWSDQGNPDAWAHTLANWPGQAALPDLAAGTTYVQAQAGASAFSAQTAASVKGFDLSAVSAFQIGSPAGVNLGIGSRGIMGCSGTYHIAADTLLTADQTWQFEPGAEVYLDRAIGVRGASALTVLGSNATYRVYEGIGSRGFVWNIDNTAKVRFPMAVTVDADIHVFNPVAGAQKPVGETKFLNPIGNVTFNGRVSVDWNAAGLFTVDPGSHVTFNEEVQVDARPFRYEASRDTVTRFNKRLLINDSPGLFLPGNAVLELNVRGNCLGYSSPWSYAMGTLRLLVPYALEDRPVPPGLFRNRQGETLQNSTMSLGALGMDGTAVLDLCGNDQSLRYLWGKGGTITSATDALLTVRPKDDWTDTTNLGPRKDKIAWTGGVGLRYEAAVANWPHFMYTASSTTGRLEVASGRLVFLKGGGAADPYNINMEGYAAADRPDTPSSWRNCSRVTVSGGRLELEHGEVFGDDTEVSVEGMSGKIKLDAGVVQRVKALYIDGVQQRRGFWGSSQSPASRQYQNDALFVGAGLLRVLTGAGGGIAIVIR